MRNLNVFCVAKPLTIKFIVKYPSHTNVILMKLQTFHPFSSLLVFKCFDVFSSTYNLPKATISQSTTTAGHQMSNTTSVHDIECLHIV